MLLAASLFELISLSTYGALAADALWGLFCIAVVWTRVNQKRFKSEEEQDLFMDDIEQMLSAGDFDGAAEYCEGDPRAIPQIVEMAMHHRELGYKKARQFVMDRFQRDVQSDIEYRLSWVSTVIKSAPMIGLFGTVFGMMGAFETLATAESVEPSALAKDINIALRTTACGLAIAIPLMILVANVNIRIAKMEDLVGAGLGRFMAAYRDALAKFPNQASGSAGATVEPNDRSVPNAVRADCQVFARQVDKSNGMSIDLDLANEVEEGDFALPRKKREDDEMDITPMIDITFLLLIFFVVCSTMDPTKMGKIPEAENGLAISAKNSAVIFIEPGSGDSVVLSTPEGKEFSSDEDAQATEIIEYITSELERSLGASKQHVMLFGNAEVKVGQVTRIQKIIGDAFEDLNSTYIAVREQ